MLERFNKLKNCTKKALIDSGSDIIILDSDILSINNIIFTLFSVKLTLESICRLLLSFDATLFFMLENLNFDELAIKLKHSLDCKINQRPADVFGTL